MFLSNVYKLFSDFWSYFFGMSDVPVYSCYSMDSIDDTSIEPDAVEL